MPLTFRHKVDIVTDYFDRIGTLDFDGAGQHLADNAVMMGAVRPVHASHPACADEPDFHRGWSIRASAASAASSTAPARAAAASARSTIKRTSFCNSPPA
jgi:hypothetical protein